MSAETEIEKAEDVRRRRRNLGFETVAYLRRKGWKGTCSTPGGIWLMQKTLDDGRIAIVNEETALHFEAF